MDWIFLVQDMSSGLLWTQQWIFKSHKKSRISWIPELILAPQDILCSTKLVEELTWLEKLTLNHSSPVLSNKTTRRTSIIPQLDCVSKGISERPINAATNSSKDDNVTVARQVSSVTGTAWLQATAEPHVTISSCLKYM